MKLGIDVSLYQGSINWAQVKASGVEVAIIRCGWGQNNIDSYAVQNINGALAAGLDVGAYWFLYGLNESDIINNANRFYEVIKPYASRIKMGFWCDWEYDSDAYSQKKGTVQTKESRTKLCEAFCETLKGFGLKYVGIYANPDYLKTKFGNLKKYPLWIAGYGFSKIPSGFEYCDIWQYSDKGSVYGINGRVDMNHIYESEKEKKNANIRPILKINSSGDSVRELQELLVKKGHDPRGVDGKFGPNTRTAVIAFQGDKGLVKDGVVGPLTWAALLE